MKNDINLRALVGITLSTTSTIAKPSAFKQRQAKSGDLQRSKQ